MLNILKEWTSTEISQNNYVFAVTHCFFLLFFLLIKKKLRFIYFI